jgi:hypothetical protein
MSALKSQFFIQKVKALTWPGQCFVLVHAPHCLCQCNTLHVFGLNARLLMVHQNDGLLQNLQNIIFM